MLKYKYFLGEATLADAASAAADALVSIIPGSNYTELYKLANRILKTVSAAWDGNVSWGEMGSIILDIASQIASYFPAGKIVQIADALWTVGNLL